MDIGRYVGEVMSGLIGLYRYSNTYSVEYGHVNKKNVKTNPKFRKQQFYRVGADKLQDELD